MVKPFADKSGGLPVFLCVAAFAMGFSPGPLSTAWTDTATSGVFGSQGSLFGVLGEWTLGAGTDASVPCVVRARKCLGLISKEELSKWPAKM